VGCGDMAQAFVIHHMYPKIRYVATDLDPYVIDQCSRLHILDGIEKRVLDIASIRDDAVPFSGFDLLVSWGMEYALDDAQLLRLFDLVRSSGTAYLLCSATTVGLLKYARHLFHRHRYVDLVRRQRLRMHGWQRSVGRFHRIARKAGLVTELFGRHGYHFCMLLRRS
jgi:hypothetical protein